MQAATRSKYGSPEVINIKEIAKPVAKDKEVLIRVYATTVNRTDCGVLWGKPFIFRFFTGLFKPRHRCTGTDFAGKVEAVGKSVSLFKVGDRVWGFHDEGLGSHAEYVVIAENGNICAIPENISYQQAAASAEGAHYAYNFIKKAKLTSAHNVMVYGATGGIGSAAVQIVKHLGATVTAVGNTKNLQLMKSLGADKVVDYTAQDFTKDEMQYDFVLDAVGKTSFGKCKPLLKEGGVYMSSELGPGNENLYLPLTTRWKNKRMVFPIPANIKSTLHFINELLKKGTFRPVVERVYGFDEIREAFYYVDSGQKTGNVVIELEKEQDVSNRLIREATVADIPQMQVVRNSVKENVLSNPALVTDKDCEDFITVRGKGWVCEADDKIVGFAIVDMKDNNVWALFLHPGYERRGIGRKLHDTMLHWYFNQTKNTVWLGTEPGTRAEQFYRAAGWKEAGMHGKEVKFEMNCNEWANRS